MPVLWPNVVHNYSNDILEYDMAENILPIPCVTTDMISKDMTYICYIIEELMKERI